MSKTNIYQPPLPNQVGDIFYWQNLHGASVGLALSAAMAQANRPLLIIVPDNLSVSRLIDELNFFNTADIPIIHFPDYETLAYDHFSPHQDIISERLETLHRIPTMKQGAIVTTIDTLMYPLPPKQFLDAHSFLLKIGDKLNLDELRNKLIKAGYHVASQVREHSEFVIRGSIIDLFPMGSRVPFRIDLFGDEIDSIRIFSVDTQRTLEKISQIHLLPAKEFPLTEESIEHFRQAWRNQFSGNPLQSPIYQDISEGICAPGIEYYLPLFFDSVATLFDYCIDNTLVISIGDIQKQANEFWNEILLRYEQGRFDITRPLLPPQNFFNSPDNINQLLKKYPRIQITSQHTKAYDFATDSAPNISVNYQASQPLAALQEFITHYSGRILFCAETTGRREVLLQLFNNISFQPPVFSSWQSFLDSDKPYGMIVAPIEEGFSLQQPTITVLTETQLYGQRVMQRRMRKRSSQDTDALIRDLTELKINDPVVHIDHGVGLYRGLQTLNIGDHTGEFIMLEYQNEDKIYIPVSSLPMISRYTGSGPEHIPISKLGTNQWQKAKRRAIEKIRDVAAELLDLYANRAARPGHAFTIPEQYAAFATAFPFEETPDQLQAIEQVFSDMSANKAMDRVICGDVGFGKTEIALRAAFLAVNNNKQVVILVPTTLLAQQHFENFRNRFADWPIQVEVLSRFRTGKEQKQILERLKEGKIDIVIGTHKLLQNDIQFKSLGLVIIDEEHRFGVKQKEKLKALRSNVDILSLTATPIPRTLNMALSGIRDLSIIATPPARRLSVKTFVHEYDNHLIKEAIQREIHRGGQVYFLHNEITTINKKAEEISKLITEARVCVAHGQMHERDLEKIMSDFYHRHYNVLVCSTIIESGIDIPTANTIIINRADKFGLAQLHQLRGRVGRSHHQAYAYLLLPPEQRLTSDAEKRLNAIASLDELGIGFTLATHDLEIRGAGELLGEEQSGNIHEIGFTLYMDLLNKAVETLKSGKEPEDLEKTLLHQHSEIDLRITALIPENYLPDVQLRLQFYKRIANSKTSAELDEIQVEMIDRFGLIPEPLKNLFAITELKLQAEKLGIVKIEANDKMGRFEFTDHPNIKPEKIIKLIQTKSLRYGLEGAKKLRFNLDPHEPKQRIQLVENILKEIM